MKCVYIYIYVSLNLRLVPMFYKARPCPLMMVLPNEGCISCLVMHYHTNKVVMPSEVVSYFEKGLT
jgi:hypothetical protein